MTESPGSNVLGLRDKKKFETQHRITRKAIELFRARGIRASSLGEIASASEISPATLFNYFPTKGALAEAWVRGEIDQALVEASTALAERSLRSTLRSLCRRLAMDASGIPAMDPNRERAVRLEAWGEAGRAPRRPLSPTHPLVLALVHWQEREQVRQDIEAITIAEMLFGALEGGLIEGLRRAEPEAALARTLCARIDLILDGARKRNERVVAPKSESTIAAWSTRPVQSR